MIPLPIPTFVINLKNRTDRKENILKEFAGRDEFAVTLVEPIPHQIGAVSLWNTMRHIVENLANENDQFVLICEDDHQFTEFYSKQLLFRSINEVKEKNADILIGGVNWFDGVAPVNDTLLWPYIFNGTQFIIVFRKFFDTLLQADFGPHDAADFKISILTQNKFILYPFISVQKDFGYSDATPKNNLPGRADELFLKSSEWLQNLKDIASYYKNFPQPDEPDTEIYNTLTIPTYIINLPEHTERLARIKQQFENKPEFDVTIVEACKHEISAVGLWESIRKIIRMAIDADDDVIIICEDDHEFTEHYSKAYLLKNVIEAHANGINYLSGGCVYTEKEVLVTSNRFWASRCHGTRFMVLYKSFFQQILDEPFEDNIIPDMLLSEITSRKMVLYPFISIQKDFGYSDINAVNNEQKGMVQNMFAASAKKLESIKQAYLQFDTIAY
jgi:GR25 family glycosyltransferase involved in LPS biosynthesis